MPTPPMPETADFIAAKSSKGKMMQRFAEYELREKNIHGSFNIRQKFVNGKLVLIGCMNEYGSGDNLPQEYTDMAKFRKAVSDYVDAAVNALAPEQEN